MRIGKRIPFTYFNNMARYETRVTFVPDTRNALVVGYADKQEVWNVWHYGSGRAVIFGCTSKAYALRVLTNILPYCDLYKLQKSNWDYVDDCWPAWYSDYLRDIWREEPALENIPGVKKWLRLKGLVVSKKKSGGLRIRKRRES